MKTTLKKGFSILGVAIMLSGQFAFAQESPKGSVTISEFSQGDPAILPSNPFYFFKGWGWSVKRLFTGTKIKKVLVNADMLDQRATEVRKLVDIAGDNPEVIISALRLYQADLDAFALQIKAVPADVVNGQVAFTAMVERLFRHIRFTDDLMSMRHTTTEQQLLANAQSSAINCFIVAISRAGNVDLNSVLSASNNFDIDAYRDIRTAETADVILTEVEKQEGLSVIGDQLNAFIDSLFSRQAGMLTGENALKEIATLATVAGNQAHRVLTLTELAERVSDSEVRSALNVARGKQLDLLRETGGIPSDSALALIARGQLFIDAIKQIPANKNGFALPLVRQLAERAEFNLTQAQSLYEQGNYAGAYGQAAIVISASRSGIILFLNVNSYQEVIADIRKEYDELNSRFKLAQISEPENSRLGGVGPALNEVEAKIVVLSQRAQAKQDSSILELNIKNIRTELARISQILNQ